MSRRPLVSVVMPSLNQREFIQQAIDSVLDQDYRPVELIVVDGVSTDGTLGALGTYGDRIRLVSEHDRGQTPAINKGFRMATGDIIGWLNADDVYLPEALSAGVSYLERNPHIDLVYGDADHIDADGRVLARYPTEPFRFERLRETCFICQPAVLFRRRVFEAVGLLDERLNCSMDYDYWIRIAQQGHMGYLARRMAQSRLHSEAKTLRLRLEHQRASIEIVKRHFGAVPASWLCAHAVALVEPWMSRRGQWQRACFLGAVTVVSLVQSLKVNRGLPRGAMGSWRNWLLRSLRPDGPP